MKKKQTVKSMVLIGMMAAVLAVLSQVSIPLPLGIPLTLQTFAVALSGFVLGWKAGLVSTGVYLLLGAVGIPVFAGFKAGVSTLFGVTGGFLWGFLLLVALCGLAMGRKHVISRFALCTGGLLLCHTCGVLQFAGVSSTTVSAAFLTVSLPFLLKDMASVVLAYVVALAVRPGLKAARLLGSTVR